jgi:hypothetical protein
MAKQLSTSIDHQISEIRFKILVAKTAELIRYGGEEFIQKLEQLHSEYDVVNSRFLTEKEFHSRQTQKAEREYSAAQV